MKRPRRWVEWCAVTALALSVIGAFTILANTFLTDERLTENSANIEAVERVIQRQFKNEVVCSESYRGPPCRALYYRIRSSIGPEERRLLVCDALQVTDTPEDRRTRRRLRCPLPPGGYAP